MLWLMFLIVAADTARYWRSFPPAISEPAEASEAGHCGIAHESQDFGKFGRFQSRMHMTTR
jgi:hypothetical protein